jgi:succinate-semialdehyde dehydrogenase/glutarate-semialdehyde dehydrogenase
MNEQGSATEVVTEVVARARKGQAEWSKLSIAERAGCLRRLAKRASADDELARTITEDTGKALFEAVGFEVAYLCELTRHLTGRRSRRSLAESRRSSFIFPHKRARVRWLPRGVVLVVGPSNFPLLNNFADAVAPLLAGNSVVLKPSPRTPKTSRRMLALWRECGLPDNVFQVVEGSDETARALIDTCDGVFFTGSVAAGREVSGRAGRRLIPCVTELGGKSAMIVLADADLQSAARAAAWSAFAGAGQVCIRTERALVEESVADTFVRLVVEQTRKIRQGLDDDRDVGPVASDAQVEHCRVLIAEAVGRGARIVCGGSSADGRPRFFAPTVLDAVSPLARVANEETFGPVLPILRVKDAEEAIALANASHLGLSGSVWSGDGRRALALARRLQTGSVCINDVLVNYFLVAAPLGGWKESGLGFRHGSEALRQFCVSQSVVEDRPGMGLVGGLVRRYLAFPYRTPVLNLLRRMLRIFYR